MSNLAEIVLAIVLYSFSNGHLILSSFLTSRDSDKHRQLAIQLGATAYLTKPHNEEELFKTIGNILNQHSLATSAQAFV